MILVQLAKRLWRSILNPSKIKFTDTVKDELDVH